MKYQTNSNPADQPFVFGAQPESENPRFDFDFVKLAFRHKWLIGLGVVFGLGLGHSAYKYLAPTYEATAKILVSKNTTVLDEDRNVNPGDVGERGEHIALMLSDMIVGKAVKKHKLDRLPSFAKSKEVVEDIIGSLKVQRSAGHDRSLLNVFDITFKNKNKEDAKRVVAAIIDAYKEYLEKSGEEHTGEMVKLISKANEDLRKEYQKRETEYLEFRRTAPLQFDNAPFSGVAATNVHQGYIKAINEQRRKNLLDKGEWTSEIKALEDAIENGESRESLEVLVKLFLQGSAKSMTPANLTQPGIENPAATAMRDIMPLLLTVQELLRSFGADHPDVINARARISAIKDFYRKQGIKLPLLDTATDEWDKKEPKEFDLVGIYIHSLKQRLAALVHRDRQLQTDYDRETKLAKTFSVFQFKDQQFQRDLERINSLWSTVITRLDKLNLEQPTPFSLEQISQVRDQLAFKRKLKFWAGGLMLGMFFVVASIYFKDFRDTTLRNLEEVRRTIKLPVIGCVPEFKLLKLSPAEMAQTPLQPALCYFHRPGSSEAESYRTVRTALFVSTDEETEKVIQVSSPEPGDGKTTFISNLAIAMAASGKRVLLIDADLRRPNVHKLFGTPQEMGTTDVISGDLDFANALKDSTVEGLALLTAGQTSTSPAELLSTRRFSEMLNEARKEFDYILVDTPPLLVVSDPCIVAAHTDGLIVVVRVGKNKRAVARRSAEILGEHGVNVVGVVVNAVERPTDNAYTYSGSYSQYLSSAAAEGQEDALDADYEQVSV